MAVSTVFYIVDTAFLLCGAELCDIENTRTPLFYFDKLTKIKIQLSVTFGTNKLGIFIESSLTQ